MPNKVYKTSAHYERLTIEAARTVYWRVRRPSVPPPVILVGCSRAGTTVVHDTIAHSRALKAFRYEPRYFWQGLFDPAQRGWISDGATAEDATPEVRRKVHEFYFKKLGGGRFLEKTCINGFKIPLLDALWPDAYFVHLHRDGRDNISSLINGCGDMSSSLSMSFRLTRISRVSQRGPGASFWSRLARCAGKDR